MSFINLLSWSDGFFAKYASKCSLCAEEIKIGQEISMLFHGADSAGDKFSIIGHTWCRSLDTPNWRWHQFRNRLEISDEIIYKRLVIALDEFESLQKELAKTAYILEKTKRSKDWLQARCDQYRKTLESNDVKIPDPIPFEIVSNE